MANSISSSVFASVFSTGDVTAPKQLNRFRSKQTLSINVVRSQLVKDSKTLLGCGYEGEISAFSKATNFRPYFADSRYPLASADKGRIDLDTYREISTKTKSWAFIPSWKRDFGRERIEKLFAAVVDELIEEFIIWSYGAVHDKPVVSHLQFWVENLLCTFVALILQRLRGQSDDHSQSAENSHLQRWRDMAMTRLANLRLTELFDVVVDWDSTAAVIDDLKFLVTNTASRSYLTAEFSATLSRRLLHPGASTIEILQVYISIIRAFRKLEAKGVLLERVARKIRRYLREREDTIKVVAAGLLADVSENGTAKDADVLGELAIELQHRDNNGGPTVDNELDWNNMDWMPDPADAAPDYMKSKNTDVIGSLISLFESKDVFVKELQGMLADRLLKNKTDFDQEIGVIEHLKIRFGDTVLQSCEVMLRDVLDSRKVDQVIRQDQSMSTSLATDQPELHSKILSRLFWPSLQEQTFLVPDLIREQQEKYEKGFEALKQTRKLTWLNAIGQVEIHIELEDRVFHDDVLPWQASVIYAFQDTPTQSMATLETQLEMTPALIRSACMFWTAKRIIAEVPGQRDTFTVLESLPSGAEANLVTDQPGQSDAAVALAAEAAAAQAIQEAEEAERRQKMAMYHQFIISMLTNQGAMPLPRIAMMLGMVVPGGFPFGNEELREFMNGMVKDGVLEIGAGGAYKVVS